jgi:hypothetical protein
MFRGIQGSVVVVLLMVAAQVLAQMQPARIEKKGERARTGDTRTGVIVTAPSSTTEMTADEAGSIYTNRGYKGVVPGIRDRSDVPSKQPEAQALAAMRASVDWVGFQPFPTYSRVFVQISGAYSFTVTRPAPDQIEVRIPGADISTTNDLHELVTRNFPTMIDRIVISTTSEDYGTVLVTVHLKAPSGYLYRQEGQYIFIDVEK